MANKVLKIEMSPSRLSGYWVAIGNDDVTVVNHKASVALNPGTHIIVWWMEGNPGSSLGISLKDGAGNAVGEVKASKIPPGQQNAAGYMRFTI